MFKNQPSPSPACLWESTKKHSTFYQNLKIMSYSDHEEDFSEEENCLFCSKKYFSFEKNVALSELLLITHT